MANPETDTIIVNARATAYVKRQLAYAEADTIALAIDADTSVLNAYKADLHLNNSQALQLTFLTSIASSKPARGLAINVPKPTLLGPDA